MMEEGFFRNKPADYVWLMLFSASLLILLSVSFPLFFLCPSVIYTCIHDFFFY